MDFQEYCDISFTSNQKHMCELKTRLDRQFPSPTDVASSLVPILILFKTGKYRLMNNFSKFNLI